MYEYMQIKEEQISVDKNIKCEKTWRESNVMWITLHVFFLCGYESKVFCDNVLIYIHIFIVSISIFIPRK